MKKRHLPCPECNSSDAFSIQDNGWGKCFSCGVRILTTRETTKESKPVVTSSKNTPVTPIADNFRAYPQRGLTLETIQRYKVRVGNEDVLYESMSPLYDPSGNHVGNKLRLPSRTIERPDGSTKVLKDFPQEGDLSNLGVFGRQAFPPGSAKFVTVTEGYEDAMAVFQMTGSKYPAVSIHSSITAERDIKNDFEYLNSFDTIVFALDNDEAGLKAAKAAAGAGFPLGKVKILTLRKHKDANEYLLAKEGELFGKEWWAAPFFKPDGLKLGSDMWGEIIERKDSFTTLYPFPGLNEKTFGIRLSEMIILTADTGVGKTSIIKHIEHHLLTDKTIVENEYGVGFLHLEEPNGDTALGLLSVHNSVPYHIPTVERPESDLRKAYDELLNNSRVVIWDHFGSNSVDAVINKVRHMVALGCKYIVVDHLSIIVSDQSGDERRQLDEIATKLKTITMELDIAVIAIIHTNRQGQIRGTAGVEQLANIVIRLERDKTALNEWRRNVTKVSVEKNRFCGYTGPACYLWYNKDTGRLTELDVDEIMTYENGGFLNDDEQPY